MTLPTPFVEYDEFNGMEIGNELTADATMRKHHVAIMLSLIVRITTLMHQRCYGYEKTNAKCLYVLVP